MRRRPGTTSTDIHAHIAPGDALADMRVIHPPAVPDIGRDGEFVYFRFPDGVVNGPVPRGIVDVEARLNDMARMGVDHQILSIRPRPFTYDLPAELAAGLAARANENIVAVAKSRPDAFSVMISLPMQSADASIAEIARWAPDRLVRGALLDSNLAGRDFADPAFDPVWAALEAADLPILVHPYQADVVGRHRLSRHYLFNLIGNPADTTIAIGQVIFGGLLDRYPNLRWAFVHGGGVAPYLLGRWDHGWARRPVSREDIPHTQPSTLFRRLWFDCLVHDPRSLRYLAEVVGWDRIMLGTDYPFDMGLDEPLEFIGRVALSDIERKALLSNNAVEFLRPR